MVTQQRAREQIGFEDESFDAVREFLADFGISPRPADEYTEDDVARAIHERGWAYRIDPDDEQPGWVAEVTKGQSPDQSQIAVGNDPDRVMALLRAIRYAFMWVTPEEYKRIFDDYARTLLGMSGEEFLQRLDRGELSPETDSRVFHLTIMRPRGA